jgi:putative membrane protein
MFLRIAMTSGVVLVSGAMALGQNRPMPSSPEPQSPTSNSPGTATPGEMQQQQMNASGAIQDKDFVHSALEGGMAEVQLGQLAAQKGASDDVKQFGQKMVQDHTQLANQMKQVADQMGVREPKGLSKKDKELVSKLNTLSGAQFDEVYIQAMVKDHKKDLSDFKQEAENSQNPAVKQVAQQGGQMIDQHLQMIEQIAKSHNVKS